MSEPITGRVQPVPYCGASLAVIPEDGYGAEMRYMCIERADTHHVWHRDRFKRDYRWKTTPARLQSP